MEQNNIFIEKDNKIVFKSYFDIKKITNYYEFLIETFKKCFDIDISDYPSHFLKVDNSNITLKSIKDRDFKKIMRNKNLDELLN